MGVWVRRQGTESYRPMEFESVCRIGVCVGSERKMNEMVKFNVGANCKRVQLQVVGDGCGC